MDAEDFLEKASPLLEAIGVVGGGASIALAAYLKRRASHRSQTGPSSIDKLDRIIQDLNGNLQNIIHSQLQPAWIKVACARRNGQLEFRMAVLNAAYDSEFHSMLDVPPGGLQRHYYCKTDLEAGWPTVVAEKFYEDDIFVYTTGKTSRWEEPLGDGLVQRFQKMRIRLKNNVIGILGQRIVVAKK